MSRSISKTSIRMRLVAATAVAGLALDATESRHPLPQPIREARSYMRAALRHTRNLMNGGGMATHSGETRS